MRHRDTNWANDVGKTVPIDQFHTELLQTFSLQKKKKKKTLSVKPRKANKMRHAVMKKPDSCLSSLGADKQGPPRSPSRLTELLCQPTVANAPKFSRLFISPLFLSNNLK